MLTTKETNTNCKAKQHHFTWECVIKVIIPLLILIIRIIPFIIEKERKIRCKKHISILTVTNIHFMLVFICKAVKQISFSFHAEIDAHRLQLPLCVSLIFFVVVQTDNRECDCMRVYELIEMGAVQQNKIMCQMKDTHTKKINGWYILLTFWR